ncbi:MAG: hypothetical protein KKI14_02715, partial [Nanoarchaeota archaeon]|nr:hypothetical protein [Nanoarchaeota archaeon]
KTQNNPKYTSGLRFGESSFKSIRGVFRHKINEIYEIEFIGGKIRTTGNHSVFVRTNHGIEAKPVSSLKSGEILVDLPYRPRTDKQRDNRAHNFDKDFHLELPVFETNMQLENAYSLAMESPFSQNQIGLQLGFSQAAISNWQRNVCVPRGLSKKYFKHNLPEKINITPDLMRLFGYYVAEGYARKEIDFCFGSEEKHLINDVKLLMKNFFGLNPDKVYNKIDDNATHIIYYSRPLADFFIRYCGKGANFKHVPPFLFEAPKKIFLEFLRGYSEGDGHLTKDGKLEITSVSKQLITELNWLCRMHGIKPSISQFTTMEGRTINGGKPLKATKAYRLGFGKTGNPFNNSEVSISQRAIIKSIKKIPFDGYVYDLCGCDNEAFFGGETPILLHNTNRPDIIDPALLRPGRFDRMIYVPAPDEKTRLEILKVHTKNMPLKGVDLKKIADKTDGYSGADLEALVREAGLISLREDIKSKEVNSKHFEAASKKIKPSITDDMFKKYHKAVEDVKKNKIEDESKASRYIG